MSDGRLGIFGSRPRESVKLILEDQEKKLVFLSSGNSYFFDGDPFNPNGGTTDFVVTKKNGEQQRCPIFSYQLVPFNIPIPNPYKELMQELSKDKPKA